MRRLLKSKSAITRLEAALLILVIIAAGVAGYFGYLATLPPPPTPTPTTPPPPAPAEIKFSNLKVSPASVKEGETVTISVDVANVGGAGVTTEIALLINGVVEKTESVTLEGGKSTTLKWTVTKTAGDYSVSVSELTGAFKVIMAIKNPDTMIVATIGEPETLDPAWCYDTASAVAIFNIYETLIFFWHDPEKVIPKTTDPKELLAPTDKFIPILATEVPTVENGLISPDGLTYTFPIRKGIKFQNGNPLTPEDVEYSFERAMVQDRDGGPVWMLLEPLLGVFGTRDGDGKIVVPFEDIANAVEVVGDNVVFHLAMPYPPFLQILCQSWASIVDKEWCIENGDWPGTAETYPDYNNPEVPPLQEIAMGTGPFKLERWEHGVEYSLIRNDDYWRGPAQLKRAIVKKIDEWSTRKLMFEAGDVDLCYVPRLYMKEVEGAPGIKYIPDLPMLTVSAVFFTFEIDPTSPHIWSGKLDGEGVPPDFFKDKDVRLGFTYSFDWETFIKDAWAGQAVPRSSPVIEGLPYFNPEQTGYSFDLTKAEEHFKKAWGGQVWEKGFKITLLYNVGNEYRRISCEMLKNNIESLNPKFWIYVRGVEWPIFLRDMVDSKLPCFRVGWVADYPDPHNFVHPFMHSTGAFSAWQHYSNPTVDALIEEGIKTVDPEKRREIYYELQRLYVEDVPGFITEQSIGRFWYRDWVQGWYFNPIYPSTDVEAYFYDLWKGY